MSRSRRFSARPPITAHAFWTSFSLVQAVPLHVLLLMALTLDLTRQGTTLFNYAPVLFALVAGTLTTANLVRLWRHGYPSRFLGLPVAILPLPLYILSFSVHWPVSLTGIFVCLWHSRWLARHKIQPPPVLEARRHPRGEAVTTRPLLASDEAVMILLFSSFTCLLVMLMANGYELPTTKEGRFGEGIAKGLILFGVGFSLVYEHWKKPFHWRTLVAPPQLFLWCAAILFFVPYARVLVMPLLATRQILVGAQVGLRHRGGQAAWRFLTDRPAQLLVYSFLLAIACGTLLLSLPAASQSGFGLNALDALFTATSAVCVTGLVVTDTGTTFSLFGQLTILGLIQIGGLGIMTISTFIALVMGQNLGLRGEFAIGEMVGERRSRSALRLVRFIVLSTLVMETLGALSLAWAFHAHGASWGSACWQGLFHSVSAFCNAGFSLFGDSVSGTANATPGILLPVSLLIILGGLGFSVTYALFRRWRHNDPFPLHSRIVLAMTGFLLLAGMFLFWIMERDNVLQHQSFGASLLNAWFQSVTARTAGFNSVSVTALAPVTQLLMIVLMFIGAAPGSTGGGVKVTTLAVVALVIRSLVRHDASLVLGGRKINFDSVRQACGLVVLAGGLLTVATAVLAWSEHKTFLALLFETVSAFGTVGLSMDVTPTLSGIGKVVVILLMFVGRVGILTLLLMIRPAENRSRIDYPAANVMIG